MRTRLVRSIQNLRLLSGAKTGNLKKVEEAIKKGADINARKDGLSAWMQAYANYHAEVAKFLEAQGAEVTENDRINAGISARMNKACKVISVTHITHHHHIKFARN